MQDWKELSRDNRILLIANGIRDNKSASAIANSVLNASRNAIIGMAHRAGLKLKGQRSAAAQTAAPPRRRRKTTTASDRSTAKRTSSAAEQVPEAASDEVQAEVESLFDPVLQGKGSAAGPVSILDLTTTTCRWPLLHSYRRVNADEMMFCGKPATTINGYCAECRKKGA